MKNKIIITGYFVKQDKLFLVYTRNDEPQNFPLSMFRKGNQSRKIYDSKSVAHFIINDSFFTIYSAPLWLYQYSKGKMKLIKSIEENEDWIWNLR